MERSPRGKNKTEIYTMSNNGISLLDKHENGLLDDKSFLSSFGKVDVFYSTPFRDHKDGKSRLFVLPARHDPLNPNSGKVMLKAGFTYEGTLKRSDYNNQGICDAAYYAILAEEYFRNT